MSSSLRDKPQPASVLRHCSDVPSHKHATARNISLYNTEWSGVKRVQGTTQTFSHNSMLYNPINYSNASHTWNAVWKETRASAGTSRCSRRSTSQSEQMGETDLSDSCVVQMPDTFQKKITQKGPYSRYWHTLQPHEHGSLYTEVWLGALRSLLCCTNLTLNMTPPYNGDAKQDV